jgi:hypothetical protein
MEWPVGKGGGIERHMAFFGSSTSTVNMGGSGFYCARRKKDTLSVFYSSPSNT